MEGSSKKKKERRKKKKEIGEKEISHDLRFHDNHIFGGGDSNLYFHCVRVEIPQWQSAVGLSRANDLVSHLIDLHQIVKVDICGRLFVNWNLGSTYS